MKINPFAFSFAVSLILSLSFLFIVFWIFFQYSGDVTTAKDVLSTTSSFFGGMTTLGAAVIAAYLYIDWKKPLLLSKITSEQKEIIAITRRMKRHADAFLFFMKIETPSPIIGLNNGDEFSIKYQKLVNDLLDDIDDLEGLLKSYQFNFKEDIQQEKYHLTTINVSGEMLFSLYKILADPSPVIGYLESYAKTKSEVDLDNLKPIFEEILKNLPDNLSAYHAKLIR